MQHPLRAPTFSHRGTRGFGKLTLYSRGIDRFNVVQIIGGQRVSLNIPICFDEHICISNNCEYKASWRFIFVSFHTCHTVTRSFDSSSLRITLATTRRSLPEFRNRSPLFLKIIFYLKTSAFRPKFHWSYRTRDADITGTAPSRSSLLPKPPC